MKAKTKDDYVKRDSRRKKRTPKKARNVTLKDTVARESNAALLRQADLLSAALDLAVAQTTRDREYFLRKATDDGR